MNSQRTPRARDRRREWRRWLSGLRSPETESTFPAGALAPSIISALTKRGVHVPDAAITVNKAGAGHLRRGSKRRRGAGLSDADIDRLPEILAEPEAVLLDTGGKGHSLLYVFVPAPGSTDRDRGKVVVRVGYTMKFKELGKKSEKVASNSVRTAGYVSFRNLLHNDRHVLLEGELKRGEG